MLFENCTDGELRIASVANETRGRLEICASKMWFSIQYTYRWNSGSAMTALACRSLGYGSVGVFTRLCAIDCVKY